MTKRIRKRFKEDPKPNLTSMSNKELKQLQAKINFLLNNSTEVIEDYNYQTFYELLIKKLGKVLKTSYQPYPIFKKQKTLYNKLTDVVDSLDEMIQSMFDKPKKLYYRKIYRMYVLLVISDIQGSPLPLGIPIVLNFNSRFTAILENNFPGYLENGLLKVIFKKELK